MITDNQVSTIESTEVGAAPSASVDLVDDSIANAQVVTAGSSIDASNHHGSEATNEQSSCQLTTVQTICETETAISTATSVLPWVSIALTLVLAYFLYKLKKMIDLLKKKIDGGFSGQEASRTTEIQLQDRDQKLRDLQDMYKTLSAKIDSLVKKNKEKENSPSNLEPNAILGGAEKKSFVNQENNEYLDQCFYGNPFSPDEKGVVKFSVRSLSKEPSPQKMFMVCLHPDGTGTYEVNPSANEYILSDLQLFSYYVKPFKFKGQLATATVKTSRPGKLVKSDKFWVIEELLEVSI